VPGFFLWHFFYPFLREPYMTENQTQTNITSEQIEALLEAARRERERLSQDNLPQWYDGNGRD
jgi:hypothetical protein